MVVSATLPNVSNIVRVTIYPPEALNICVGFWLEDIVPSLKLQLQYPIGIFDEEEIDESIKHTGIPTQAGFGYQIKLAIGP